MRKKTDLKILAYTYKAVEMPSYFLGQMCIPSDPSTPSHPLQALIELIGEDMGEMGVQELQKGEIDAPMTFLVCSGKKVPLTLFGF